MEGIHRLGEQRRRIAEGRCHRELAGVNARDVDQVSDQPVHPGGVALNALRPREGLFPRLVFGGDLREVRRAEDDPAKQIAQVVADDAQEVVTIREGVIGTNALGQQVPVGLVPLQRQQLRQCTGILVALASEALIRGGPLVSEGFVLERAFFGDGGVRCILWLGMIQPLIRLLACRDKDGVRVLPRAEDHHVGILLENRLLLGQRSVGLFPLDAQALVLLVALRRGLLGVESHPRRLTRHRGASVARRA